MKSIRRQMLVWLFAALMLAAALAAVGVYSTARAEARSLFDYQMQLMAAALPNGGFPTPPGPLAGAAGDTDMLVVQIWDTNGDPVYLSSPDSQPPQSTDVGFSTIDTVSGRWRVYNTVVGNNIVQISQPTEVRERLAHAMAVRTILPFLLLMPILAVVVWIGVGRGLQPLNKAAAALSKRSAESLEPLPDQGFPREVSPLVSAINGLLARLQRSFAQERTFIADAAHGLRTPLTALRLQVQLAERTDTPNERQLAYSQLRAGMDRLSRLAEQLLALARSESTAAVQSAEEVDLPELAREVAAELAPMADAKHLDLSLTATEPIRLLGSKEALRTLLANLIDNAIRYTPVGGGVEVEVGTDGGRPFVAVADTGPGIPEAERGRVFDRFYRHDSSGATGSGLGLAIVRQIAQRHGADIVLGEGIGGHGLRITVRFGPSNIPKLS